MRLRYCTDTRVLASATIEERVPPFLIDTGKGRITAEYSMLPRGTQTRTPREVARGRPGGRTQEIQRLIGHSLRPAVDLRTLGERTVTLDCIVLQTDGGTRTAAITHETFRDRQPSLTSALIPPRGEGAGQKNRRKMQEVGLGLRLYMVDGCQSPKETHDEP